MARNSGIFWAMLEMSLIIGNTFAYFQFSLNDTETIDRSLRNQTVGVLLGVAVVGVISFFFLLPTPWVHNDNKALEHDTPLRALTNSFKLFATKEMLMLIFYFFYMGLQVS